MIKSSLTASELWKSFNWKKASKRLFRLQKRVYKAVQRLDKRNARKLQKLILKSKGARMLAIRHNTTQRWKKNSRYRWESVPYF